MKASDTERLAKSAALRYTGQGAPNLVAKGEGAVADRIREVAVAHNVPVLQDDQLTGLLCQIPIGDEIPESLYVAVAEILAYVYRLDLALDERI